MARYWVYLNDAVSGPYGVEQLIRLRGFSRQTLICVDDASGKPTHWISPAEIPELAHIFKAADEHQAAAPAAAPPKAQPKPSTPRLSPKVAAPAAVVMKASPTRSYAWVGWLLGVLAASAAVFVWSQHARRAAREEQQRAAQMLVENARLPPSSSYATLNQYIHDKALQPRWDFERMQDALYHVTLSWYSREGSSVYAFETNHQAQTARGINTAAIKLLSEGFTPPPSSRPKPAAPVKKKSPSDSFAGSLDSYRQAVESGDFQTAWGFFSRRKRAEMAKAGMSKDGFMRLQSLTFKVDSAVKQSVLKTKDESEKEKLVLLKQSQTGRPDIFVKQFWTFEEEEWKLDDEEKRAASTPPASEPPPVAPATPPGKPAPTSLPGMSN